MQTSRPIVIGGQQFSLRYPGLVQIAILRTGGTALGLGAGRRLELGSIYQMALGGDAEAQAYLLWQGIVGGMPDKRDMKFDEAVELRDAYLEGDGELDDGSRYLSFLEILGEACDAAVGADRKKSLARRAAEREKAEQEKAEKLKKAASPGAGNAPQTSA